MAVMSKAKDTKPDPKRRHTVFVTLDDDTEAALEKFRGDQVVPPDRAAVTLKGLQKFLEEQGYFKPPAPKR